MSPYSKSLRLIAAFCIFAAGVPDARPQGAKTTQPASDANGQRIFASNCAACHGLDGKGSERAPNIADSAGVRGYSDSKVFQIIHDGIAGTGMPAFHALSKPQIEAVVAHLRVLGGSVRNANVQGDPVAGKKFFFGDAGCSRCHMIAGEGGFIASDLSEYAREHQPEEIRGFFKKEAVVDNGHAKLLNVTLHDGRRLTGRIRNEDNFSIQLQSQDGAFHLLEKSEIERMDPNPDLQMPDYSSLSASDINNLIVYLQEAAHASKAGAPEITKRQPDDDQDQ